MRQTENDDLIAHGKMLIIEGEYHTRKTLRALLLAMGATRFTKQATARAVSKRFASWIPTSFCSTGTCP